MQERSEFVTVTKRTHLFSGLYFHITFQESSVLCSTRNAHFSSQFLITIFVVSPPPPPSPVGNVPSDCTLWESLSLVAPVWTIHRRPRRLTLCHASRVSVIAVDVVAVVNVAATVVSAIYRFTEGGSSFAVCKRI